MSVIAILQQLSQRIYSLAISMDTQKFSEWLAAMSVSEKIRALVLIYSLLTIHPRQLLARRGEGKGAGSPEYAARH
jgi:hypothetical protein